MYLHIQYDDILYEIDNQSILNYSTIQTWWYHGVDKMLLLLVVDNGQHILMLDW